MKADQVKLPFERASAIELVVFGHPEPAGSKRSLPIPKRGGGFMVNAKGFPLMNTVDDNPKSKAWKRTVAVAGRRQYQDTLLAGPLKLTLVFVLERPGNHFGARGHVLRSARDWPTVRPDLLKLSRAVEDGLTGVVWRDDAQIVQEVLEKRYGEPECVIVRIEVIE